MPRSDVTVIVHLRLLPECIAQGRRDLLDFARTVKRREPECSAIEIVQDVDDPTRITMIEKWSDRETYEGPHLQTQHMKSFVDQSSQYFDGPASISFCEGTVIGKEDMRRIVPYGR